MTFPLITALAYNFIKQLNGSTYKQPTVANQGANHTTNDDYTKSIEVFLNQHGGCDYDPQLHTFIPKNPDEINKTWIENRDKINDLLGSITPVDSLKTPDGQPGSFTWENTPTSLQRLHETAVDAAPEFMRFLNKVSSDVGAETSYGPGNKFVIKSKKGMWDKVHTRMRWAGNNALACINDCLRGTIMVKDIDQAKQLISHLTKSSERMGYKIAYSNKFQANYPEGYVGIHARLLYTAPNGEKILAEIQIHFNDIENGTPECPSQHTHKTYETVRILPQTGAQNANIKTKGDLASKAEFAFGMTNVLKP